MATRYRVEISGRMPVYGYLWVEANSAEEAYMQAEDLAMDNPQAVDWTYESNSNIGLFVQDVQHNGYHTDEMPAED